MTGIPLIDDPQVLAVPIEECGEPLVDLRGYPVPATTDHPRAKSPAETRLHCREGVAKRLVAADRALPDSVNLLVLECHRPLELQRLYWKADLAVLREKHPEWSEESPLMRTYAEKIPEAAKKNRRMLVSAMEEAGFANYGHEWWHYSYGDRYWVFTMGRRGARYGFI